MDQNHPPVGGQQENKENAPGPGAAQNISPVPQNKAAGPAFPHAGVGAGPGSTEPEKNPNETIQRDGGPTKYRPNEGDEPKGANQASEGADKPSEWAGTKPKDAGGVPDATGEKPKDSGEKPKILGDTPKDDGENSKDATAAKPPPADVQKSVGGDKPPAGVQLPVAGDLEKKPDEEKKEDEDKENLNRIGSKPGDQWPAGKIINALRPNQDTFDDEIYTMKCFTPETLKTDVVVVSENISGRVIDPSARKAPSSGHVINSGPEKEKFVKVSKNLTQEDDEEEEEEDEEVVIPSLVNKGRLQILRKHEGIADLEPLKPLTPKQQEIHNDTAPFLHGFLVGYEKFTTQKESGPATTLKTQSSGNSEQILSASQEGRKFSEICFELKNLHQPIVKSLVDDFFQEIPKAGSSSESSLKNVLVSYKKIATGIFRDGFTWSRVVTLFSFTFDVFTRLFTQHTAQIAQEFVSRLSAVLANIGLVAWVTEKGGWKKAFYCVSQENPKGTPPLNPKKTQKCGAGAQPSGGCMFAGWNAKPAQLFGAAGAAAAAGAAYYFFRR